MSVNDKEFMAAFDDYIETVETSYNETFRATALDMFSDIVKLTPVDEGRLRANWQVGINEEPDSEIDDEDESGENTISAETEKLADFEDGYVSFVNNLPYAEVAEYGLWGTGAGATSKTTRDGFSVQAPYGMVRVTLTKFEQALQKAAQDNKV